MRVAQQPLNMSIYKEDHDQRSPFFFFFTKAQRCAHDATCSNVLRTGGPDAPFPFIFFLLHDIRLYLHSHEAPQELDRTKVRVVVCVCVCGVGWGVRSAWMGARGRARVFPRNNNNREGNDDKLKLEHFNFKEPQADKKKGRGPRIDAILIGNTYLATPAVDDLVTN